MKRFEEIPHTADWSFRAYGQNLTELFENAAYAMFELEGAPPLVISREQSDREISQGANGIQNFVARAVNVTGIDYESLLVNWLTELLWLQESNRETYHRFQIETLTPTALRAHVFGAPMTQLNKVIKAVTYHNLKIEEIQQGFQVTIVVDV